MLVTSLASNDNTTAITKILIINSALFTFSKSILLTPAINTYKHRILNMTPIRIVNWPPYSMNGTQFINNNDIDVRIVI